MLNTKETGIEKMIRKTGMKPTNCKCNLCKSQCQSPCQGLPEDMVKLVDAGYADRLTIVKYKDNKDDYSVLQAKYDPAKKACTFFTDGLCELHDKGLKPTAGKLSHHTQTNKNPFKTIAHLVVKQWAIIDMEYISVVVEAVKKVQTLLNANKK